MRVVYGYVSDYVRSLNPGDVYARLGPFRKLLLRLLGVVRLERVYVKTPSGTEDMVSIYLARCPHCGNLYVDYPHGYSQFLECPRCSTRIYL